MRHPVCKYNSEILNFHAVRCMYYVGMLMLSTAGKQYCKIYIIVHCV